MPGSRPLTDNEITACADAFRGRFALRNRTIFLLQYYTGRRITQTLLLRISDLVGLDGKLVNRIYYRRSTIKGKKSGEEVLLHPAAREIMKQYIWWAQKEHGLIHKDHFVFQSNLAGNRPLNRIQLYRAYKRVFIKLRLPGRVSTHSLRKSYADRMYDLFGQDIYKLKAALGHRDLNSTVNYMSFRSEVIDEAILQLPELGGSYARPGSI